MWRQVDAIVSYIVIYEWLSGLLNSALNIIMCERNV